MPEFKFNLKVLPLKFDSVEPFNHIKVPKVKCFSSYFGKSSTGFNVPKIPIFKMIYSKSHQDLA